MKHVVNIRIDRFLDLFNEIYDWLYNYGNDIDVRNFAAGFDRFAESHKDFVGEFVKYRGDFVSSDREAAAFMCALLDMEA